MKMRLPRPSFTIRLVLSASIKPLFESLVVAKVRAHQALPEFSVIWHAEMEQLVNNYVVLQVSRF
jgi:hypothetical protein